MYLNLFSLWTSSLDEVGVPISCQLPAANVSVNLEAFETHCYHLDSFNGYPNVLSFWLSVVLFLKACVYLVPSLVSWYGQGDVLGRADKEVKEGKLLSGQGSQVRAQMKPMANWLVSLRGFYELPAKYRSLAQVHLLLSTTMMFIVMGILMGQFSDVGQLIFTLDQLRGAVNNVFPSGG